MAGNKAKTALPTLGSSRSCRCCGEHPIITCQLINQSQIISRPGARKSIDSQCKMAAGHLGKVYTDTLMYMIVAAAPVFHQTCGGHRRRSG